MFLQNQKQLALCYKLFNKAEIYSAGNGDIQIKSNDLSLSDKENIKFAASNWQAACKLEFKNLASKTNLQSLKAGLIDKAGNSASFKLIQKHFPRAAIREVVFNNSPARASNDVS